MRSLLLRAIWVWVLFFLLAVLNGMLRERLYIPEWGELVGRIGGTLILALAVLIVMYVFLRRNAAALTRFRLFQLGVLWLGLSVFFEFGVSHWVMEEEWEAIMAHYSVMSGRVRVLLRLIEFAGPLVLGGRLLRRGEEPTEDAAGEGAEAAAIAGPAGGNPLDQL
jgi:hypothetical protein